MGENVSAWQEKEGGNGNNPDGSLDGGGDGVKAALDDIGKDCGAAEQSLRTISFLTLKQEHILISTLEW